MRLFLYSIPLFMLTACSTVQQTADFESIHLYKLNDPLPADAQVSIQTPLVARFGDAIYQESGVKTASAFKSAFAAHTKSVIIIPNCEIENCLDVAKKVGANYFTALNLVYWEDRATNWSGKADRLTIKISIYDVSSGALMTSSYLHTNSSIVTPIGGHVEDFLPSLASQYVSSLY